MYTTGQYQFIYSFYSMKTITFMESPHKDSETDVCVCVWVCKMYLNVVPLYIK